MTANALSSEQLAIIDRMTANLPQGLHVDYRGSARHFHGVLTNLESNGRMIQVTVAERDATKPGMMVISPVVLPAMGRAVLTIVRENGTRDQVVGEIDASRPGRRPEDRQGEPRYFSEFRVARRCAA
ncbi:hypothetical protein J2T57_001617 [Natronocella acetinitrilica]|uniref:Uncharacterized protein n=1 Tax=Natronocella acetinitrilica TaxID=414046 RepID=A0AAE3G2A8_9GAMM|nr:hypothetical protein [Natronocella acetinitrilica]MCP1674515.1 hypothetical protein [Natronocella acetinitrilica]